MAYTQTLAKKHSFVKEALFQTKITILIVLRCFENLFSNLQKHKNNRQLNDLPVVSFSESELWSLYDNDENRMLTAGKIQNLRIAARIFNGLEIPANEIFSFWKHVGNPNFGKGFVIGREVREGCIVPSIAGGMCQLSNAFYDAALKAGFEILERHKHTRVIAGSLAEQNRDATVKWNYLDLRFRTPVFLKIVVELNAEKLIVQFKAKLPENIKHHNLKETNVADKINDCYSCGNTSCFKYPNEVRPVLKKGATLFILDEMWPEHENYINAIAGADDKFIVPFNNWKRLSAFAKYNWNFDKSRDVREYRFHALKRLVLSRGYLKLGRNIFASSLKLDEQIVRAIVNKIPVAETHLVVSQNLLPFLNDLGVLGGRTYDVLMTRLPMEQLHQRLDDALKVYPQTHTLNDFRANTQLVKSESKALNGAKRIITPHAGIAELFNNKSIRLKWSFNEPVLFDKTPVGKVLFPGSAVARKGAYEIKRLATEHGLNIVVTGSAIEHADFWEDAKVEKAGKDIFQDVSLVVYPPYVEHSPRILLKAISKGIPVVITTACGIPARQNVMVVSTGNYEELNTAVKRHLYTMQ